MATDNSDPIPPHKTFDTILVLDFGSQVRLAAKLFRVVFSSKSPPE
jgi:hypothetical protein